MISVQKALHISLQRNAWVVYTSGWYMYQKRYFICLYMAKDVYTYVYISQKTKHIHHISHMSIMYTVDF